MHHEVINSSATGNAELNLRDAPENKPEENALDGVQKCSEDEFVEFRVSSIFVNIPYEQASEPVNTT